MEIPNYDSDTKNKKFKRYSFMPNDTFRMLICGNSGSGKTNLLYHMLIEPLLYYDEIHLYATNLEQERYQNLMNKMNEISREAGYDKMTVSNDKIIPINDLGYEDNQKLVIFDDYVCEKNQRQISSYKSICSRTNFPYSTLQNPCHNLCHSCTTFNPVYFLSFSLLSSNSKTFRNLLNFDPSQD